MKALDIMNESQFDEYTALVDESTNCVYESGSPCPYHQAELEEGAASRKLCLSKKSDKDLGASMLASCKAQGLRARDGHKKARVGKKIIKLAGKRIKSSKYGGPLPTWNEE